MGTMSDENGTVSDSTSSNSAASNESVNDTVALGAETLAYSGLNVSDERNVPMDAVALVEKWLADAQTRPTDPSAQRLADVLRDPNGLAFTVGFVDGVMRPEDVIVAGTNLGKIAKLTPETLPSGLQFAIRLGGVFGPAIPWVVIPIARRVLRKMVGHLVLDASDAQLGPAISQLRESGNKLNINLLGEAVLGEAEAASRLQGTTELLARDDVDYVSIKVSNVISGLSMWDFDGAVEHVVATLTPLYRMAAQAPTPKFINLDMEEYRDLDLTIAVFQGLLDQPEFTNLEAGIVLQAYLPDALDAMQRLTQWARSRRARGGAAIKVRLVKGANLAMERVDATVHGWPLATVASKQDADTNYKRVLHWSLTPERTDAVRLGVAGHNLFDVAWAWLLAGARGVRGALEFEMLLGMAPAQAAAVQAEVGPLRLYTPVVHPAEFDSAIAYLIRRLEENATEDNFMSAVFELSSNRDLFDRERDRFLRSVHSLEGRLEPLAPNRRQDRAEEAKQLTAQLKKKPKLPTKKQAAADDSLTNVVLGFERGSLTSSVTGVISGPGATPGFSNEPDTDPSIAANRQWGRDILARAVTSQLGTDTAEHILIETQLIPVIDRVRAAAVKWGKRTGDQRAAVLHHAGIALAAARADLIEVMASEAGKTIAEADAEVSEAIDFAHYYAERSRELDRVQGATFVPAQLTLVTPPWNFPVAIPAGGVLAALAAGSGVIIKPASRTRRSAGVMVEALWRAGIDRDLLACIQLDGPGLGERLIANPKVDQVILTGGYETAEMFKRFRPDLPLLAETSGKNAIIVTPSADLDLAAADVLKSAFGHAGQKCSAASLVIVVGSVARSQRFARQLLDGARSLRVGRATAASTQMGPLVEPAAGKLLGALTTLGEDESWLLEPTQIDDVTWTPGIRNGVKPGSEFHQVEYFGPVLGIMRARTLTEAIEMQNAVAYGLTAGIHSLDQHEIEDWIEHVQAGNLYVNRGITGAIVQRQPFGGWKRSAVGAGSKAGGPNYLFGLGDWKAADTDASVSLHLRGLDRRVIEIIEAAQPVLGFDEFERLRQACLSDAIAWQAEYGVVVDHSGLRVERNLLRYRALPVALRIADDASVLDALRVLCAALLSHSEFTVSVGIELPRNVRNVLMARGTALLSETDEAWLGRLSAHGQLALSNLVDDWSEERIGRVRLVSSGALTDSAVALALGGTPDVAVWAHEATNSGRVELLPFLHEQAISITAHRFGNPNPMIADLHIS